MSTLCRGDGVLATPSGLLPCRPLPGRIEGVAPGLPLSNAWGLWATAVTHLPLRPSAQSGAVLHVSCRQHRRGLLNRIPLCLDIGLQGCMGRNNLGCGSN